MPPRNRIAYRRSLATRAKIRALLETWPPLMPVPTAEIVRQRLGLRISTRTVRWHIAAIRLAAELAALTVAG